MLKKPKSNLEYKMYNVPNHLQVHKVQIRNNINKLYNEIKDSELIKLVSPDSTAVNLMNRLVR